MDFSLIRLLEEETNEKTTGILSSGSRITIALTVAIVIVTGIAIYLLAMNQKLSKKLREIEEEKE